MPDKVTIGALGTAGPDELQAVARVLDYLHARAAIARKQKYPERQGHLEGTALRLEHEYTIQERERIERLRTR